MRAQLIALSFGLAALIALTNRGHAQEPPCGTRDAIVAHLEQTYGETRQGLGLAENNAALEVFASDSGSWTILVTQPSGPTCLLATGEGWQALHDALPPAETAL